MKKTLPFFISLAWSMLIVFVISYLLRRTSDGSQIEFLGIICKLSLVLCLISFVIVFSQEGDDSRSQETADTLDTAHTPEEALTSETPLTPNAPLVSEDTLTPDARHALLTQKCLNALNEAMLSAKTTHTSEANITSSNNMVYYVKGVRGRHLEVYEDRCVLRVKVTLGSLLTGTFTNGEKTIYYVDCIGTQFKKYGPILIGYLQLETAARTIKYSFSNFFNENSFTFDRRVVTNEKMLEIRDYIHKRLSEIKNHATPATHVSAADEIKKFKQLLDAGILTQNEFDAKKKQLLGL